MGRSRNPVPNIIMHIRVPKTVVKFLEEIDETSGRKCKAEVIREAIIKYILSHATRRSIDRRLEMYSGHIYRYDKEVIRKLVDKGVFMNEAEAIRFMLGLTIPFFEAMFLSEED